MSEFSQEMDYYQFSELKEKLDDINDTLEAQTRAIYECQRQQKELMQDLIKLIADSNKKDA